MGEGRSVDLDLSMDDVCDFLDRAAARTAAVVEPEEFAKSAKPRNPVLLIVC